MKMKYKLLSLFIAMTMVAVGVSAVFGSVSASPDVQDHFATARTMRDKGLEWLRTQQQADGSWVGDIGVTSLAALAFVNAGYGEDDHTVSAAVEYILGFVKDDGSITSGAYANYYSATAVMVLAATGNTAYDPVIRKAAQFIVALQSNEDNQNDAYMATPDDWEYGGIGYGGDGRPDLSNQQFALMALHSAEMALDDFTVPEKVWERSRTFISRCQNLPAVNDMPWALETDAPADGGYVYFPGNSKAGGHTSYGSMTAAGIWSYLLSGGKLSDLQVTAALDWTRNNYAWSINPGIESDALFYYQWTMSRALTLSQASELVDGSDWFADLTGTLSSTQSPEGFWLNTNSNLWWEDVPELATAFAILALETRVLSGDGSLVVKLTSGVADVRVLDQAGNVIGEKVVDNNERIVTVSNVDAGTFRVEVTGKTDGDYTLDVIGEEEGLELSRRSFADTIRSGEKKEASIVVSAISGAVSIFSGELVTTAQASAGGMLGILWLVAAVSVSVAVVFVSLAVVLFRKKKR